MNQPIQYLRLYHNTYFKPRAIIEGKRQSRGVDVEFLN